MVPIVTLNEVLYIDVIPVQDIDRSRDLNVLRSAAGELPDSHDLYCKREDGVAGKSPEQKQP